MGDHQMEGCMENKVYPKFKLEYHLGFSVIQADLTNLPILPNFVKIKNPLKVLKFNFSNFISFWNTLT